MPIADLDSIERALQKRGFTRDDALFHDCESCKTKAVATYKIRGRSGGRDISLCLECGVAHSWRSNAAFDQRVEDPNFDLRAFLA